MTEFGLFIVVGVIAVAAAIMMLLSENAVYSALYLIVTMACIAFLFLLLNAPFLAMIQITVYAGAIMVLFIFVIMLLGAERVGAAPSRYRWLTPVAVSLAAALLLIIGIAIAAGDVDEQLPPGESPLLRVVNLAPDAGDITVYFEERGLAAALEYGEDTPLIAVEPGDAELIIRPEAGEIVRGMFPFAPGTAQTAVVFGTGEDLTISIVPTSLEPTEQDYSRITFFNAYEGLPAVDLVDLGTNGRLDADTTGALADRLLIDDLEPGEMSQAIEFEEGEVYWAFVGPNGNIVSRIFRGEGRLSYDLEREVSQLIVLAPQRSLLDEVVRPVTAIYMADALPAFGGPEAIGIDLFTRYLLPFEALSVLLLAALVGAIVLTHKQEIRVGARDRSIRRRVSRPLASVIAAQVGHDVTEGQAEERPALPPAEGRTPAGD